MSHTVWRIATDTPTYQADDLTGAGARASGGRWNEAGTAILYASETRALAYLETVVHLNAGALPLIRYMVALTLPDDVWTCARRETSTSVSVGWDAKPAGQVNLRFGAACVRSGASALLVVTSVIVPEELNVLINPGHPDSARISAAKIRKWLYDQRLINPD